MCKIVKIIFLFAVAIWLIEADLQLSNEEELNRDFIKTFSNSSASSGWLVLEYINTYTVKYTAKGTGGADEVRPILKDDNVVYMVIRVKIPSNDTSQKKFRDIFGCWIGPKTTPAQKSKSDAFLREAQDMLQPFYTNVTASDIGRFTNENIANAIFSENHVV